MVRDVFGSDPSFVALLTRCCRLYLNATPNVGELLAGYCALQLTAPTPHLIAPPTPAATLLSKASAALGFGGGADEMDSGMEMEDERAAKLQRALEQAFPQ